ncbi:hypothetical protein Esti_003437 [Eimeria stiedai]
MHPSPDGDSPLLAFAGSYALRTASFSSNGSSSKQQHQRAAAAAAAAAAASSSSSSSSEQQRQQQQHQQLDKMTELTDAQHKGLDLCLQRLTSSLYGLMDATLVNEDGHLATLTVDSFLMEAHIISIMNSCRWLASMAADLDANVLLHAPKSEREEAQQQYLSSIPELQQLIEADSSKGLMPFPSITQLYQQNDTQQQQQQHQQQQS